MHEPSTHELAQQLVANLNSHGVWFKKQNLSIIHFIDEALLAKEQEVLDNHDEELSDLLLRVQQLIQKCSSAGNCKVISCNITDVRPWMDKMETAFSTLFVKPEETHLYHYYEDQPQDLKGELGVIRQNVLLMSAMDAEDLSDTILELH